jgi:2-polyprenyl-3-methyl-5-hydroxy-6-metoxy-1,4-benzoquinol methylase
MYPEKMTWTPERIARFWDYVSTSPELYFTHQFGAQIVATLKGLTHGKEILDYGCGAGHLISHLIKAGFYVRGADYSEASVKSVADRYAGTSGFLGTSHVDDLLKCGNQFDTIISAEVIEHLEDDSLSNTLDTYKSLLRPGGILLVTTPNDEDMGVSTVLCPCCNHTFHRWQHVRSWNKDTLAQYFMTAGFKPTRIFATNFALPSALQFLQQIKNFSRIIRSKKPRTLPHLVGIFTLVSEP